MLPMPIAAMLRNIHHSESHRSFVYVANGCSFQGSVDVGGLQWVLAP
jgi:hypothetical protein